MCGYLVVETGSIEAHLSMGAFGTLHVLVLVPLGLQGSGEGQRRQIGEGITMENSQAPGCA